MTPIHNKMKFIVLTFFLVSPLLPFCQEKKTTIHPGFKAGMALSRVGPDQTDDNGYIHKYSSTGGIRFGGFLQIAVGKSVVLQPELLFVVKGAREETQYGNGNPTSQYPNRVNYIEIPLNVLFRLASKQGSFLIGGGPAPSFSTNNYSDLAKKSDMGLNFLAIYQWPIGFSVDLNYTMGLSHFTPEYIPGLRLKNNSWGLSVGYMF